MAKTTYFTQNTNTNTQTEGKTITFTAVLLNATPTDDGKAMLKFTVTGHPYRSEYSKKVSLRYVEDMFGVFNSYLKEPLTEFDADELIERLIEEKASMRMWSTSIFDKKNNKYNTDSSFYPKRD